MTSLKASFVIENTLICPFFYFVDNTSFKLITFRGKPPMREEDRMISWIMMLALRWTNLFFGCCIQYSLLSIIIIWIKLNKWCITWPLADFFVSYHPGKAY